MEGCNYSRGGRGWGRGRGMGRGGGDRGSEGGGRGMGRGGGDRGSEGGGRGGGDQYQPRFQQGGRGSRGPTDAAPSQLQAQPRPVQGGGPARTGKGSQGWVRVGAGGRGAWSSGGGSESQLQAQPPSGQVGAPARTGEGSPGGVRVGAGGRGAWSGAGGSSASVLFSGPSRRGQKTPESPPDVSSLKISEQKQPPPLQQSSGANLVPLKRPDRGGKDAIWDVNLLVNHFLLKFDADTIMRHYDVDVKAEEPPTGRSRDTRPIPKPMLQKIYKKRFSEGAARSYLSTMAYDGMKNIFSAVELPAGETKVELSDGRGMSSCSYIVTLNLANELKLCKLNDYISGELLSIPRDVLQGMDVVMKDNPSNKRILVGQSFHCAERNEDCDLGGAITASKGFQQSLKLTSHGLSLCVDYTVLALCKQIPVLKFLSMQLPNFNVNDFPRQKRAVVALLKGLKVTPMHRPTTQKYTIVGLTDENTRNIYFDVEDREGNKPPNKKSLVGYFRETYGKEIKYKDIPCLDFGRKIYLPIEFCMLVGGERYPKEKLNQNAASLLRKKSLARPSERKDAIYKIMQAQDGPCGGEVAPNFKFHIDKNMTKVVGRGLMPPCLKMRSSKGIVFKVTVDNKCQWSVNGKHVWDAKPVDRWALLDFSSSDRYDRFIQRLKNRCGAMGIRMGDPVLFRSTKFSGVDNLRQLLASVKEEASKKCKAELQIIFCVMAKEDPGHKFLKFISETEVGVLTQCLSPDTREGNDQFFSNLVLKSNMKLGGSNFELEHLPYFGGQERVMFIGADVNHPGPRKVNLPSVAAVVATVNWPGVNQYAARICPQEHGKESIVKFGSMCSDLVDRYAQLNKVKPKKIIVFRDGVSEGQFDMVLNEELRDLKEALYTDNYHPTITVIVAIKRHQTRLFLENQSDGVSTGNASPGTVVDTTVCHPFQFDFYLCSHYGIIGTSKFTHYFVLWDEHNFTSDQIQRLTYHLCFTFGRCTKPVSLVPPVFYADLVAYRGRMYQEAVTNLYPSSETEAFKEEFYKLHPNLENTMFFM